LNNYIGNNFTPGYIFVIELKNTFDFSPDWREDDSKSIRCASEYNKCRYKPRLFLTMKRNINTLSTLLVVAIVTSINAHAATQKYITDEFEVTMRSGTSTSNNILKLLKSGEAVTVIEEVDAQYFLVTAEDGKQGYVLGRYLVDSPSSKNQLEQTQKVLVERQQVNELLQSEIESLQADIQSERSSSGSLTSALQATENELARIRDAAENTLGIIAENEALKDRLNTVTQSASMLGKENAILKDSSNMDWFLRGAGVSLIAFLLGIMITRIRWRKRDSWGSY